MRANIIWQWLLAVIGLVLAACLAIELAVDQAARREFVWLAGITLMLFLSAIVGLFFSQSLGRRIRRLEKFSRRVAAGDFRSLPPETYNDDLAALARAMNETATRLAQTIRSLTEEHSRTAAILESMAEGVAVVGVDERVVFSNAAFAQIIGWGTNPLANGGATQGEASSRTGTGTGPDAGGAGAAE